jgi:hypothetical protein
LRSLGFCERAIGEAHGHVWIGTDLGNFAVITNASPPPPGIKVTTTDLSALRLGGKIHLGDPLVRVISAVGHTSLHPVASATCPGNSTVGFCSWKSARCERPPSPPYVPDKRLAMVFFHNGRVVALAWDDGACGFG